MTITIPIRTISEANRSRNEHWATTRKRVKSQREAVAWFFAQENEAVLPAYPMPVTLTRIAPRSLDSDNLARSMKAVRDEVAKQLGVDDGDTTKVTWKYDQRKGKPKEYAVEITIQAAS